MNHRLDLDEQEQLANLKAFWDKYGNFITTLVTVVLVCYAAFNGWRYWELKQSREAVVLFEGVEKAVANKDMASLKDASGVLLGDYKRTAYASKGALIAAKAYFEAGDAKQAKAALQWVADNGFSDAYKAIARIRLAGLLLDEKAFDEALKVLDFSAPDTHLGLQADRRGDVYFGKSDNEAARKAYAEALAKLDERDPWRAVVQLKLESITQ